MADERESAYDVLANDVVSIVGELFPDCKVCCSEETGGDLCQSCKRAHRIIVRELRAYAKLECAATKARLAELEKALDSAGEWVAAVDPKLPMPGEGDTQAWLLEVIVAALAGGRGEEADGNG